MPEVRALILQGCAPSKRRFELNEAFKDGAAFIHGRGSPSRRGHSPTEKVHAAPSSEGYQWGQVAAARWTRALPARMVGLVDRKESRRQSDGGMQLGVSHAGEEGDRRDGPVAYPNAGEGDRRTGHRRLTTAARVIGGDGNGSYNHRWRRDGLVRCQSPKSGGANEEHGDEKKSFNLENSMA
nr:hypothetical protein Iba_chr02aCG17230 [Ipomoea batatas]